jgi:hypothetical protein
MGHEEYLDLAAAQIDFALDPAEQSALDAHLADCPSCRRRAIAMRADAREVANLPRLVLAPARADRIRRSGLRGPRSNRGDLRLLAVAAAIALLAVAAVAAGSAVLRQDQPLDLALVSPGPTAGPSGRPTQEPGPTASARTAVPPAPTPTLPPTGTPTPTPVPAGPRPTPGPASLPVGGATFGTIGAADGIRLAPGVDGRLHVTLRAPRGLVLTLLDAAGEPMAGWPILLPSPGHELCTPPIPVADGSVRLACASAIEGGANIAYAFDAAGVALAGWPVAFDGDLALWSERRSQVVGGQLLLLASDRSMAPAEDAWIIRIDGDGSLTTGTRAPIACCTGTAVLAPDGVAYVHSVSGSGGEVSTEIAAFDGNGIRSGWPVTIPDWVSAPAFDASGRIYLVRGSADAAPARTVVLDRGGRDLGLGSPDLPIASTSAWQGAGAVTGSPVVAPDGGAWVASSASGTVIYGLDSSGRVVPGWPYASSLRLQDLGACSGQDVGCGYWRSVPVVGPDGTIHLLHDPATDDVGATITAIGRDGNVRDGWPVNLQRPGATWRSLVVGPSGVVFAVAIEPESGGWSATVVAFGSDSLVRYRITIAEP